MGQSAMVEEGDGERSSEGGIFTLAAEGVDS